MPRLDRRQLLASGGLAAGGLLLPRFAIGQADTRPTISIAVQQVATSANLEVVRERSNVGERVQTPIFENLIARNLQSKLEPVPGLAESWRRIDERTVELSLRKGVKFHNGDEMNADDVVFTFGPERMFGSGASTPSSKTLFTTVMTRDSVEGKNLPPEVVGIAKRIWPSLEKVEAVDRYTVRFVNRVPDVTLEGRLAGPASEIISRRGFMEAKSWIEWSRKPVATGPYKVREFKPDESLVLDAHDDYWGGRPPIKTLRFVVVPEVVEPHQRPPDRRIPVHLRRAARPGDDHRAESQVRGPGRAGHQPPHHRLRQAPQAARRSARPPGDHPCHRPPGHRRQPVGRPHPRAAGPAVGILRQDVHRGLDGAGLRSGQGARAAARRQLQGRSDPVPRAQQLLHQPGRHGADPGRDVAAGGAILVEMWRSVGLNVQIEMRENWQQIFENNGQRAIRDWSNSAGFSDPISSIVGQHGPQGQQQQSQEWTNVEMNTLSGAMETEFDLAKRKAMFKRMLEICEREDPAYTVLHQTATFTAKRKDIVWKAAPAFQMDFRAGNFRMA